MALGKNQWVEEFLFRGRPPGSNLNTAAAVQIGTLPPKDWPGGPHVEQLDVADATKKYGITLEDIMSDILRQALEANDALRAANLQEKHQRETAELKLSEAVAREADTLKKLRKLEAREAKGEAAPIA